MTRPLTLAPTSRARALQRHAGAAAEALVERSHDLMAQLNVATLAHQEPRFVHQRGAWVPVGRAPVDYRGVLSGGKAVSVEVKRTATGYLWLRGHVVSHRDGSTTIEEGDVRDAQRAALDADHDLGALVLLVVVAQGQLHPLPWGDVRGLPRVTPDVLAGRAAASALYLAPWVPGARR